MKHPLLGLGALLLGMVLLSLHFGSSEVGLRDWLGELPSAAQAAQIVLQIRLPRTLVGLLVGGALAVSGAALQALFRNPLADPSVLGVSASAALGAQLALFFGLAGDASWLVPAAACSCAVIATLLLIGFIGRVRERATETVILGGVALAQLLGAGSALLISFALADYTVARRLIEWMLGSLDGRSYLHVFWGAGPVLFATAWLLVRARQLDALLLGEVSATGLGVDVARLRQELVIIAALLSGISVAIGGVIGFVGLVVPHALRRLLGARHLRLIPACFLGGASFVIGCDVLARRAIAPEELQIGILTAALGAPLFLVLLRRRLRSGLS